MTDIANYFDNIDYRHLRNVISTVATFDEVILDVLFQVLDGISWRPDYLPSPGKGLPQVDFDAPRLLSHVFLFEIDSFLKGRTGNSFVRWVDDITIALGSVPDAKEALRDLDELLMTRGLRLNSGKTHILSSSGAAEHFWQKENGKIDSLNDQVEKLGNTSKPPATLRKSIRALTDYVLEKRGGHWDKVVKRLISLLAKTRDDYLVVRTKNMLVSEPSLRESVLRYLELIGPTSKSFQALRSYLIGENALDDSSVFTAARVLTLWSVAPRSAMHLRIRKLGVELSKDVYINRSHIYFLASLWLLGKYGLRSHIYALIDQHKELWRTSSFLSRQVASMLPKFRKHAKESEIASLIEQYKHPASNSVLISLKAIGEKQANIPADLVLYAVNGKKKSNYGLERVLICLHILLSDGFPVAARQSLRSEIMKYVQDPLYLSVLASLKI